MMRAGNRMKNIIIGERMPSGLMLLTARTPVISSCAVFVVISKRRFMDFSYTF